MVTFYVIRHGETLANRDGIFQGHMDVPLSDRGRRQAELAGEALKDVKLDAVYSSDLCRASETARALMKHHPDCALILDRRLREVNGGILQGLTIQEVAERHPEFQRAFAQDPYNTRRPGGESIADLYDRVARAMEDIYEWNRNRPEAAVAVVSHGGAIRSILQTADPDPLLLERVVGNCSISVITRDGDGWHTVKVGDAEHLRSLEEE